MDSHQRRRRMNIAHDESDSLFLATLEFSVASHPIGFLRRDAIWEVLEIALEAVDTEISPARRAVGDGGPVAEGRPIITGIRMSLMETSDHFGRPFHYYVAGC